MAAKKYASVLIVDDNETTRMLLRAIIRDGHSDGQGYELIGEASNGTTGIELALRLKPDIICLDNVMPKVSGLDVLRELRPQLPQTAILIISATSDRETVQAAIQGGANGYIVKPFNALRVLAALKQALAGIQAAVVAGRA